MNSQNLYQSKSDALLELVRNELKVFNTLYLGNLNLMTAVGWSVTDEACKKYCQMLTNIEYHLHSKDNLNIYFKLELFNTSSVKYLLSIIKRLNQAFAKGKKVKIYWSFATCNEEEILDAGVDLAGMCDFPFKISRS